MPDLDRATTRRQCAPSNAGASQHRAAPSVFEKIALAAALVSIATACRARARGTTENRASLEAEVATLQRAESVPTEVRLATPFVCHGDRCVQRYPRLPDDGEWTCSDMAGAAVCSGGEPPAGVPLNTSDAAWICGKRRTSAARPDRGERVCVDLAPDFPNGAAGGWRCHYATDEGATRVCDRDADAHVIGDRCDAHAPCLDGLRCVTGRCTPDRPSPTCVLDDDCDDGVCRIGSCWRGPP